jgi:hypothetical protein
VKAKPRHGGNTTWREDEMSEAKITRCPNCEMSRKHDKGREND